MLIIDDKDSCDYRLVSIFNSNRLIDIDWLQIGYRLTESARKYHIFVSSNIVNTFHFNASCFKPLWNCSR